MFKSSKRGVNKKNAIVSLLLVAALVITGALAFLTAKDNAENKFTVGNVAIDLTEPNWDESNGENIVAGQVIAKDPTITNTGRNEAYVYMMVQVPKADEISIAGSADSVDDYQLFSYTINDGWALIDEKVDANDANNYYLYAYNTTLAPEGTATLFNEVTYANTTSDFEEANLSIEVTAYAIQSNFYNEEATDAESAWSLYVNQNGWEFPSSPTNPTGSEDDDNIDPVQVFSLNNLADNGNIESIFRNSPAYAGSPNVNATYQNTGTYSMLSRSGATRATTFDKLSTGDYYIACRVRVDDYVSVNAGVLIDGGGNNETPVAVVTESTNNEFVSASGIATISDETQVSLIFGGSKTKTATCYIDDIVFIPLSAFESKPTKEQLDSWYEAYLNNLEVFFEEETALVKNATSTFVNKMKNKAQEIGMTSTTIVSADGNNKNDQATARDAMKMMIAASKNETLSEIWQNTYSDDNANGTYEFTIKNGELQRQVIAETTITDETLLTNYNILGGKTGTGTSTRCIGVIAEIDGQKVVAVIMGATSEANRYSAINDLLGIASNKIADSNYDTSTEVVEDAPSAIAAIITDDGYDVVYEQDADTKQSLASMTKVLTVLTALDYIEDWKTETVKFKYTEEDRKSTNYLYMYDEFTFEDAFYNMMLPSSNATARVVARTIGEMNSKS